MPLRQSTFLLPGSNQRPMLLDITYDDLRGQCPVVVYAHGFNGFKDWGNFNLIAEQFVQAGFTFVKFNFSHNGTTPEQPEDFADLEAFAENNYTRELHDLDQVLQWITAENNPFAEYMDSRNTGLIGHSMGGGISILQTAVDKRIRALVTWASITACKTPWGSWPAERMAEWRETGVQYYLNGRTQQQMPMHYQLYEDYVQHQEQLDILQAATSISVPFLICHGTEDTSVSVSNAYLLHGANPATELFLSETDHVFGRKHPWTESVLPEAMQQVTDRSIAFFHTALQGV